MIYNYIAWNQRSASIRLNSMNSENVGLEVSILQELDDSEFTYKL